MLATLEEAGIDRERVMGVDCDKVDGALEVTELSESDVYEVEDSEYVRKTEVDEERRETRLQGLKDQLAAAEGDQAEELRQESPLKEGETVRVAGMSSTEPTLSQQYVIVEWMGRELGVPLERLEPLDVNDETKQAIEDWHYWLER